MDSDEKFPLIEQLKFYNLEHVIPLHFTSDDDDEEGYCHTYGEMDSCCDPTQDEYYDQFDFNDDEENDPFDYAEREEGVRNLDEFCNILDIYYMDYRDLLNMNIWDLFGITKNQFDLIDWSIINENDFGQFFRTFVNDKREISVEKKILYTTLSTLTNYPKVALRCKQDKDEALKYMERIIDTHNILESQNLIGLLSDYWRFYEDAVEMNRRREDAGELTFRYTLFPKPKNIRDLHHKAFRDHMELETERMAADRKMINAEIKAVSQLGDYKRFLYTDGRYIVKPVESQDDLEYEGEYLDHCVASYGSYMARAESFIYCIRVAKDQDIPFYTAEILPPEKKGDRYSLNQLYTFQDSIEKTVEFRDFVNEWAKKKGFTIL